MTPKTTIAVDTLMRWPWTWLGPTEVSDEDGTHFELRIAELADFFVAGLTVEEAEAEKEEALRAFLESFTERGEHPPRPQGIWTVTVHAPVRAPVRDPAEAFLTLAVAAS